jgi:hypothetical protein
VEDLLRAMESSYGRGLRPDKQAGCPTHRALFANGGHPPTRLVFFGEDAPKYSEHVTAPTTADAN